MKKRTFRKLEALLHFLTATLLFLKALDLLAGRLYFPGTIIIGLAIIVLTISTFWRPLRIRPKQARIICYYLESPALLLASYMLHLENKDGLAYIFLISAILYPMMGFISTKKFKRIKNTPL